MVKQRRDLSGALNAKHNAKKKTTTERLLNPFEAKPNKRQKNNVLNRGLKGADRNVALARRLAHEKRKRTLLVDYKTSTKANTFADKRFGESNTKLTEEEKILERFKRLRSKKSLYDLSDTEKPNQNIKITHLGQSLSGENDVSAKEALEFEERLREEGVDEHDYFGDMDAADIVEAVKRGDHQLVSDTKRSKKEIMEEVIAKAKLFKMQRQKEKEEDEEERERLDEMFKGMMQDGLFQINPTKKSRKDQELQDIMDRLAKKNGSKPAEQVGDASSETEDAYDEYEQTVAQLAFEARGAASDRTLTPEEKAAREFEKLKAQQDDLQRRMEGRVDIEGDDDDFGDSRRGRKKRKEIETDEENLNETDAPEPKSKKKAPVLDRFGNEIEGLESDSDSESEEESDDEDDSGDSDSDDDDAEGDSDSDRDDEEEDDDDASSKLEHNTKTKAAKENDIYAKRMNIMSEAKRELPFVLECPESHIAFVEFLSKYPNESLELVITRIRKSNSVFLDQKNREKMSNFLEILIQHLCFLVDSARGTSESIRMCLCGLYDLASDLPDIASQEFCNHLQKIQLRLAKHLRTSSIEDRAGGDYGCLNVVRVPTLDTSMKKKGGHKVSYGSRTHSLEKHPNRVKFRIIDPIEDLSQRFGKVNSPQPGATLLFSFTTCYSNGSKGKAVLEQEKVDSEHAMLIFAGGILASESRCWPSPGDFAFLRAVETIFPVTDFRHVVISPTQLLLGQYLTQCPLRGPRDVVASLCTCQTMIQFVKDAKRFASEVPMLLECLIWNAFAPIEAFIEPSDAVHVPLALLASKSGKGVKSLQWLRKGINAVFIETVEKRRIELSSLSYEDSACVADTNTCATVLFAIFDLVGECCEMYSALDACEVVLGGIRDALALGLERVDELQASVTKSAKKTSKKKATVKVNELVAALNDAFRKVNNVLANNIADRKGMRLLDVSARSIQMITPLYNENFTMTKDGHDMDKTRVETKRLKKELKKSKKDVARELRKDAIFLAEVRQQEKQKHLDGLRAERQKNFNFLMEQTGVINKAVREYGAKGGGSSGADMRGRKRKTGSD